MKDVTELESRIVKLEDENQRLRAERNAAEITLRHLRESSSLKTAEDERNHFDALTASAVDFDIDSLIAKLARGEK
jgi:hypothetical protein